MEIRRLSGDVKGMESFIGREGLAVKANAKGFVDTDSYWENVRWLKETVSKLMEVIYL